MEVEPSTSSNITNTESNEDTTKSKLGNCEVCVMKEAKYTCPKCEVKTCCLRCSVIHKRELECDGARDRTKFIPLNKFTNLDLSSDYRLLEEITRTMETYKRDRTRKFIRKDMPLPHYLFKLKNAVQKQNTILKFLPPNFARHKQNTTRLNFARGVVFWHIDWIFSNAENLKLVDEKIRETEKLANVLQKYFTKQDNELLQEKLQYYQAAGLSGIKVLLKAEEKSGEKFYELDLYATIQENLKNKIIIEYPTIHIVIKEHVDCYNVIDSDNEDGKMDIDVKTQSGTEVINRIVKNAENDDSIYKSLKNLLFISENSDGEISDE